MSWHIHSDMSFADSDAYGIDTDIPEGDGEPDPWDDPCRVRSAHEIELARRILHKKRMERERKE